jgi:membrane-bound acyltransferase YfiQ involved in biofilm formation
MWLQHKIECLSKNGGIQMVKEIFVLRSVGCLCIVFLHSIYIALTTLPEREIGALSASLFDSLQLLLYFGTPMFIFISQFLISYSYRERPLPNHFLTKRFRYILIPFSCMAFFYSLPTLLEGSTNWLTKFAMNVLLGDYHGYFILIIFQFYLFHKYFNHYLRKMPAKVVFLLAFLINGSYLWTFNFTSPPDSLPYSGYIWERLYWMPLFGWLFYFVLGYYAGLYYEKLIVFLERWRYVLLIGPLVSSGIVLFLYHTDIIGVHSSKRIDILFHTTFICFCLFYLTSLFKKLPQFLVLISRYSFGIYLLHYFYIFVADYLFRLYPLQLGVMYIFLLFGFSLVGSIVTIYWLNKWRYGYLIIGKVGVPYVEAAPSQRVKIKES